MAKTFVVFVSNTERIPNTTYKEKTMTEPIKAGAVHHLTITVTDVGRSQAFYE